ncbi:hypothetical protein IT575_07865 [bacterium]|nr:hypothetical protein [bacterium]
MKREVIIFIAVYVVFALVCGLGAMAVGKMPEPTKNFAGLAMLPLLFVPLIMAFVCNRLEGSPSGPFRGLTWGGAAGIWSAYGVGLLAGLLVVVASVGLGMMGIDPEMTDYLDMMMKSGGQEAPASAAGMFRGIALFTLVGSPTIGAFFGAFIASLVTLPWYGWLGRRLLTRGRAFMVGTLMLLSLATGWTQAMAPNPMLEDVPTWFVALSYSLAGMASALAGSWFFLRYRSGFVPALFGSTFNGVAAAAMVVSSDVNQAVAPPAGLSVFLGLLVAGIALWVLKDPGGENLAIAAVGPDGEPLTPSQLAALNEQASAAAPAAAAASATVETGTVEQEGENSSAV